MITADDRGYAHHADWSLTELLTGQCFIHAIRKHSSAGKQAFLSLESAEANKTPPPSELLGLHADMINTL